MHLNKLVCLSRSLIGGGTSLASQVLGRVLRPLPGDFRQRYGHSPKPVENDSTCASMRPAGRRQISCTWDTSRAAGTIRHW